jgi:hypothetical protein
MNAAAAGRLRARISWLILCLAIAGCGGSSKETSSSVSVTTQLLVSGLNTPLDLEQHWTALCRRAGRHHPDHPEWLSLAAGLSRYQQQGHQAG